MSLKEILPGKLRVLPETATVDDIIAALAPEIIWEVWDEDEEEKN